MEKKKILIIDDDESFGNMVKLNLEAGGEYDVTLVVVAAGGEPVARRIKPDLILLDIKMMGESGLEVLDSLKKNKETASIPVVMLTVVEGHAARIQADQLKSDGYLMKPVTTEALKAKIEDVLKSRK